MRYRAIVFDFDGTLVDSNLLKREAYNHAFSDQPVCLEAVAAVMEEQREGSRSEIIHALAAYIPGLDEVGCHEEAEKRMGAYSSWVERMILQKAAQSPARSLLPRWSQEADLYICSLTPVGPLRSIVDKAGWRDYFKGVEGYPISKKEMLGRTMKQSGLATDQLLMVGDGDNDEEAAVAAGTAFFRIHELKDLLELDEHLHAASG